MKLHLYINGIKFNSINLPKEEFENDPDVSFEDNVEQHRKRLEEYCESIKTTFFRQLVKCKSYELVLIVESNMHLVTDEEEINYR